MFLINVKSWQFLERKISSSFFQTKCLKIIFDRPRLLPAMKRSPRFRWPSAGRQKTAKTWRAAAINSSCRTSCRLRTRNELTWTNCRQNIQQLLPWPPIRSLHFCSRLVEAQTGAFLFGFSRARAESNTKFHKKDQRPNKRKIILLRWPESGEV